MANERSTRAVGFFKNIILTKKGKEMLLSSNNNIDNSIEFNICKFGDGRHLESEIDSATDIKSAWMEQSINTVRIDNSSSVPKLIIEITFSNKDMTEPRVMSELGIFAKDKQGKTHLFAYCLSNVETGEDIEIENDYPTTFKISIISIIDNNTNVTNIIDPDGFLTKEVIELLKESIRNIAFRKIRGTLTEGQSVIQVPQGAELMPVSQRATVQIEGEIYFIDRDYTINTSNNTITLANPFRFKAGDMYEIIDPLPPTYVKDQIQEFIDDFKKLVSDSKIEFENFKKQIYLEIDQKIEEVYRDFDEYVEQNKENLKGYSVDVVVADGQDANKGNKYKIIREDGKEMGAFVAPAGQDGVNGKDGVKGDRGLGVADWVSGDNSTPSYPTARLVLEDGSKTPTEIPIPIGPKGDSFRISKTYSSIAEMEADFDTDEVFYGEYVVISSSDQDNGKLFEKTVEGFIFVVQMGRNGMSAYETWLSLGNVGTEEEFIESLKPNYVSRLITIQANGDRIYGWFDLEGNRVGEYVSAKGDRGEQGIPGVNWDGTIPEYPDIPTDIPYGTLFEVASGVLPPSGWVYANGGQLPKGKFPHLIGVLPHVTVPETSPMVVDRGSVFQTINTNENKGILYKAFNGFLEFNKIYDGEFPEWTDSYAKSQKYAKAHFLDKATSYSHRETQLSNLYHGTIEVKHSPIYFRLQEQRIIHRLCFSNYSRYPDRVLEIQVKAGDVWTTFEKIKQTEMLPHPSYPDSLMYILKNQMLVSEFRIILSPDNTRFDYTSTAPSVSSIVIEYLELHFGEDPVKLEEVIKLPLELDSNGGYKIIYVGQPVAQPREIQTDELKIGYVYDENGNVKKSHENQDGFYYDVDGKLRYKQKSFGWEIWDSVNCTWIEDTELKEKAKKELLNNYIELEMKKDKMIQMGLETNDIELEIEAIKKDLEKIDGKI